MWMRTIICSLTVLTLYQGVSGIWFRTSYDSPEERALYPVLQGLSRHIDDIAEILQWMSPEFESVMADLAESRDLTNTSSQNCQDCVRQTGVLKAAVAAGFSFEDLRNISVAICYELMEDQDWRGDVICEGAVDTWGPHIVYILNTTELNEEEICLMINNCQPEDIVPEEYATVTYSPGDRPQTKKNNNRRQVDYEEAIKVWQITDVHLEPEYATGTATDCDLPVCCKEEWAGTGYASPWGDYKCNLPLQTVDLYLDFMASMDTDYVMYTGDTSPNTIWEDTQVRQNNMSQILINKLNNRLGLPSYMSIGNHDAAPTNLYYAPRSDGQKLNSELWEMWQSASNFTQEQLDTMMSGGYYTVLIKPGLRVLEYNSNIQATDNYYILLDQENNGYGAMRQFMEDTFDNARANGEKVIVLSHHLSGGGGSVRAYSDFVTDICRRNADLIVLHLLGHSHSDSFQMNTDPVTGDVYDVQISAASMTGQTDINPEAKLFYLHPDTYDVLDVDTFYLDLQNPQINGSNPMIELAYRATVEYNMTDFTPASVKDLVDRMEQDEDLLNKYLANRATKTGFWGPCDANCQKGFFCDIRTTSYTQEQECNRNN